MTTYWGSVTISGSAQAFTGAPTKVCKFSVQMAPSCTGQVKLGPSTVTVANTTPGTILDSSQSQNADSTYKAGDSWSVESHDDHNTIVPAQYFLIGTHATDVVFWEAHVN